MKPPATGRPRVDPDDHSVQVTVTLPARQYDAFAASARRSDLSIPEVIRRELARRRTADDDDNS